MNYPQYLFDCGCIATREELPKNPVVAFSCPHCKEQGELKEKRYRCGICGRVFSGYKSAKIENCPPCQQKINIENNRQKQRDRRAREKEGATPLPKARAVLDKEIDCLWYGKCRDRAAIHDHNHIPCEYFRCPGLAKGG